MCLPYKLYVHEEERITTSQSYKQHVVTYCLSYSFPSIRHSLFTKESYDLVASIASTYTNNTWITTYTADTIQSAK